MTIAAGAAIIFSAPVTGTTAAVVGLTYGIASLAGGSDYIDEVSNDWGKYFIYGD